MISPRQAIIAFFLAAASVLALISTLGSAMLPAPFDSIGPATTETFRADLVEDVADRGPPGCLLVLGNSRVAFHVNAVTLSTPSCPAKNLGYPGLGPAALLRLLDHEKERARPNHVVVFLTEDFLIGASLSDDAPPTLSGLIANPQAVLEKVRQIRWIDISLFRVDKFLEAQFGRPLGGSVWIWDKELGRWEWPEIASITLSKRADIERVVATVVAGYYGGTLAEPADVARYVERIEAAADKVTIVSPPEHSAFRAEAERVRPGMYDAMKHLISQVAASKHIDYVDCAQLASCDVPDELFSDPVHFHGDGTARFTQFLKSRIETRSKTGSR